MANRAQGSRPDEPSDADRDKTSIGMPEDVAALFAWANLSGARYWDFSASRRRYRQQVRALAAAALAERRESLDALAGQIPSGSGSASNGSGAVAVGAPSGRKPKLKEEKTEAPCFLRSQQFAVAEAFVESSREAGSCQPGLLWEPAPLRAPQPPPREDPGEVWRHSLTERYPGASTAGHGDATADRGRGEWSGSGRAPGSSSLSPEWIYSDLPGGSGFSPAVKTGSEPQGGAPVRASRGGGNWAAQVPGPQVRPQGASLAIVFAHAGGVGCTSLLANLGRALSRSGESVALGETSTHPRLPFYFGAREIRPGVARAFASPMNSSDPAVFVASYDLRLATSGAAERQLMREILRNGLQANRIVLELPPSAEWLFRRLAPLQPVILVPIIPDVNAVLNLDASERYFEELNGSRSDRLEPHYVLNQMDTSLRLHDDVREILEHQLGPRLVGGVRRSALVDEALAHGLAVIDYAAESGVAQDYMELADWVRSVTPDRLPQSSTAGVGQ